jgi:CheY-like chemotaxis protein
VPKHILLVDDTQDILRLMRMVLEEQNHLVSVLESGQQVLSFARQQRPDVIVLDLWLGQDSGVPILQALKNDPLTAGILVIVYSASVTDLEQVRALIAQEPERYEGTVVLRKPFELNELLAVLE